MNRVGALQKSSVDGSEGLEDLLEPEEEAEPLDLSILERKSWKDALMFSGAEG